MRSTRHLLAIIKRQRPPNITAFQYRYSTDNELNNDVLETAMRRYEIDKNESKLTIKHIQSLQNVHKQNNVTVPSYVWLDAFNCFKDLSTQEQFSQGNYFIANQMLMALCKQNNLEDALLVLDSMKGNVWKVYPNNLSAVLRLCSKNDDNERALEVFSMILDPNIYNYSGAIKANIGMGQLHQAYELFVEMERKGIEPDEINCRILLSGCVRKKELELGKLVHQKMIQSGYISNRSTVSVLFQLYENCEDYPSIISLFDQIPFDDNTMNRYITSLKYLIQKKQSHYVIELLDKKGQKSGLKVDDMLFISLLSECAQAKALDAGKLLHERMAHYNIENNSVITITLAYMYGSCNDLDTAKSLILSSSDADITGFEVLMTMFADKGMYKGVTEIFKNMEERGISPSVQTVNSLLVAHCFNGNIDEVCEIFNSMDTKWNIFPTGAHEKLIIQSFARCSKMKEAEEFIERASHISSQTLITLLEECSNKVDLERALRIQQKIREHVVPQDNQSLITCADKIVDALYAKLNSYNEKGRELIRAASKNKLKRIAAHSAIEVDCKVRTFYPEDKNCPEVHDKLMNHYKPLLLEAGYKQNYSTVFRDVSDEERSNIMWQHSEKLALVYALENTPDGTQITFKTNLRMCADCHEIMKYFAKITNRKISVRDASRFHHYTPDGKCSCNEYF
jgi:pentatricopeptide repeat protein